MSAGTPVLLRHEENNSPAIHDQSSFFELVSAKYEALRNLWRIGAAGQQADNLNWQKFWQREHQAQLKQGVEEQQQCLRLGSKVSTGQPTIHVSPPHSMNLFLNLPLAENIGHFRFLVKQLQTHGQTLQAHGQTIHVFVHVFSQHTL